MVIHQVGLRFKSITKEGDGLLLDFKHHGIMNSMDDDRAVDIYSYYRAGSCGERNFQDEHSQSGIKPDKFFVELVPIPYFE